MALSICKLRENIKNLQMIFSFMLLGNKKTVKFLLLSESLVRGISLTNNAIFTAIIKLQCVFIATVTFETLLGA